MDLVLSVLLWIFIITISYFLGYAITIIILDVKLNQILKDCAERQIMPFVETLATMFVFYDGAILHGLFSIIVFLIIYFSLTLI